MEPDLIVGVDPGKMTGWASYRCSGDSFTSRQDPQDAFVDVIVPWIESTAWRTDVLVICERFVVSSGTVRKSRGDENWSAEQIGVLRHTCRRYGVPFELQSPSDAMKFATNDRLKEIGWHLPGRDHANDAARHVLLGVARHRPLEVQRLLAG